MIRFIPAAAIVALALGATAAFAQSRGGRAATTAFPAGTIEGRVLDDQQAPVAGAMISVLALGGCAAGWLGLWPRRFGGSSADQ